LDTIDQILKNSDVLLVVKSILSTPITSHDLIVYLHLETTWILINLAYSSSDSLAVLLAPEYSLVELLKSIL
jgi:hypothetical protein